MKTQYISNYYKVPGRDVYCETLWQWFKSVLRCHIVLRINPPKLPSLPRDR